MSRTRGEISRLKVSFGHAHVTREDYTAIVAQTSRLHHRLLLRLLWTYGLRISEVLEVRARDIDFENAMITVQRLKKKRPTKDELPIPRDLVSELREACRGKRDHERLIPITRQAASKLVKSFAKRAGVGVHGGDPNRKRAREVHLHAFRHGRVYDLVTHGVSPLLVARILGHSDLGTLMTYFHPQPKDIEAALTL